MATYPGFGTEWDFDAIKGALDNANRHYDADADCDVQSVYIGTWLDNAPSGKIYAVWTTNQTEQDVEQDDAWREYTETGLTEIGASLESGEGDSNDLFAVRYCD